jgi:hypothetical protein
MKAPKPLERVAALLEEHYPAAVILLWVPTDDGEGGQAGILPIGDQSMAVAMLQHVRTVDAKTLAQALGSTPDEG